MWKEFWDPSVWTEYMVNRNCLLFEDGPFGSEKLHGEKLDKMDPKN